MGSNEKFTAKQRRRKAREGTGEEGKLAKKDGEVKNFSRNELERIASRRSEQNGFENGAKAEKYNIDGNIVNHGRGWIGQQNR